MELPYNYFIIYLVFEINDKDIKEMKLLSYCYGLCIGQNRTVWIMVRYGWQWMDLTVEISGE
ncbi:MULTISPECIES: hypothetical protein [Bacillus]|uniref:hypothetical protein n=1 Tax=Bacillus TaxID=1386 RepID=UPI0011170568|nr:hypothetical protein [Bacillus mycoides]HDR7631632.1 hypothetical protein [Bacillus mycoides]